MKRNHNSSTKVPVLEHAVLQRFKEILAIFGFFIALYLLIALLTYHRVDPAWSTTGATLHIANAGGRVGAWLADVLLCGFGYFAFLFPFAVGYFARIFSKRKTEENLYDYRVLILKTVGFIVLIFSGTGLSNILLVSWPGMPFPSSGGIVGEVVDLRLESFLNPIGTVLLLWPLFLGSTAIFTGISWLTFMNRIGHHLIQLGALIKINISEIYQRLDFEGFLSREDSSAKQDPELCLKRKENSPLERPLLPRVLPKQNLSKLKKIIPPVFLDEEDEESVVVKSMVLSPPKPSLKPVLKPLHEEFYSESGMTPPLRLLDVAPPPSEKSYSSSSLETMSREVELRLMDFGVQVQVVAVHPGPVITRFELALAPGVKVSKISNLAKDLARSLSVVSVRIVDVIPGKSVVGLEVPNEQREVVYLSEIIASAVYEQSRSPLSLALGKDISGHPVVVDLSKMPHLLVAGTTGSGKSVGLNVMLLSLLYKASPEKVRLIMIDPKMLELSIYDGIPHLLAPVVTDMKEAANALRWCVAEMDRRYRLMAALGVRNLAGYNHKIEEAIEKGTPILNPILLSPEQTPEPLNALPYVVVVIDEFADMMMVVGKKVEELIARIAQKARAAGIHMILATQRPSVDVITGLIKANVPTRIAFQVSSRIDSRTILDQSGAEQLLGYGDMLYLAAGTGIPVRVHGAYAADHEVHAVANYLKQQGTPDYLSEILQTEENSGEAQGSSQSTGEQDPFYDQAVQIVLQTRRASISNIQRRLKIGYNRAARIIEDMESAGIVSEMSSNGNREILVESSEEMV
jgi:DNA segregation ATPase FtsK/SpoIIIE, S-DNA-T family